MPCRDLQTPFRCTLFALLFLVIPRPCHASAKSSALGEAPAPVLYLVRPDANAPSFFMPSPQMACREPNLVVVTHGWYEQEPWPGWTAMAIAQKVDIRLWRCGWWDWRGQAKRLRPVKAATIGRDEMGPLLGRRIVQLSKDWRHVHLVGHSAGSWVVNAAAEVIAAETEADIHITFLDAYVPDGWDESILGRFAQLDPERHWIEHYFTRDLLNLTENRLSHAHNVDITAINPGFKGHKFPWHWYHATVTGRYTTRPRFADSPVICRLELRTYGFARALESGVPAWENSLTLPAGGAVVRIEPQP